MFFQEPPRLANTYRSDAVLREHLQRLLPGEVLAEVEPELDHMGEAAAGELLRLADQAEAFPPRLVQYDPWGRRVDRLQVSPAWAELHAAQARAGLCALPYEDRHGRHDRVVQHALLHLYGPSSAVYTCHVAMTDAAARVLLDHAPAELRVEAEAAFALASRGRELLGRLEHGQAGGQERQALRALVPTVKLLTAKDAVAHASEVVEAFGGAGYVEDTGIPRLLRNAQVLPIWEGTTNVLSLDLLRAMDRGDSLASWTTDVGRRLSSVRIADLNQSAERVAATVQRVDIYAKRASRSG